MNPTRTPAHFVLRGARAMDKMGSFGGPTDVLVSGGLITSVGRDLGDQGVVSVDAAGLWLMPGIADCHAHLGCFTASTDEILSMSVTRWTLEVARNAGRLLDLGITLVRDPATTDAGVRDAIASGAVPGPTLRVSGGALSQTGGHGDGYVPNLGLECAGGFLMPEHPGRGDYRVDGPEQMRVAVRKLARAEVDWIKLCTTGGLLSTMPDHPSKAEFTVEEIEMAVAEATHAGIPVCAHAYGGAGLDRAVAAGVKSIEHGLYLTERQAAEMAARDCWLVPTLAVCEELGQLARTGEIPPFAAAKALEVQDIIGQQVAVARAGGVRIALGSDLVVQGANLRELVLLHAAGMPAEEVLVTATSAGAELLGLGDTHGQIAPGYVFDAVLLDSDPREIGVFAHEQPIAAVFQHGRVVRPHASWNAPDNHNPTMEGTS